VGGKRVSSWELVVGMAGLAVCRSALRDAGERSRRRIEELRALLTAENADWDLLPATELDSDAGYAQWASAYDAPGNPLIAVEQPVVRGLLDRAPLGHALDAACGTGRHAAYLASAGHEVVGVDSSAAMLEMARARLPDAELRLASLEDLPFPTGRFDLAVSTLALTHLPRLDRAVAELARVVRPGGHLVLSDIHPTFVEVLDTQARFRLSDESGGYVRNHVHLHSEYLAAFRQAGVQTVNCIEARMCEEGARGEPLYERAPEIVTDALVGLPYLLVWELARG
jgi:ubiquinone/menaquinone biosynthesis C-methylase UbiE